MVTEVLEHPRYELLEINYINGKRAELEYNNRKKYFKDQKEIDDYREYLCDRLKKDIYLRIKDWRKV